jgi:phosphatidylglycerol lysyltransferase
LTAARLRKFLVIASALIVGGLVLLALYQTTRTMSYHGLVATLRSMPARTILAALAATAASFAVLIANDLSALSYVRAKPPLATIVLASFCGYALGNAIGMGSLSGGAVRYRVYAAAGLSAGQIARVTIFIAVAFGLGVAAATALGLLLRARELGPLVALSPLMLRAIAGLALVLIAALLVFCAGERAPLRCGPVRIELPALRLVVFQLAIGILDIAAASTCLWVLIPETGVDFIGFATIYGAAVGLGVLSHAPGGLGVFEAVMLYAIGRESPVDAVAAALVAYRAIYFLLPVVIATTLLAGAEIRRSFHRAARTER